MPLSCKDCQFCAPAYEHAKVCIFDSNKPRLLEHPYNEAEKCTNFLQYNRWGYK